MSSTFATGGGWGKPIDVALSDAACVTALIVPSPGGFLSCLKPDREGVSIPWGSASAASGTTLILVELDATFGQ